MASQASQEMKSLIDHRTHCAMSLGLTPDTFLEWLGSARFKPFFQKLFTGRKILLQRGKVDPEDDAVLLAFEQYKRNASPKLNTGFENFEDFSTLDYYAWFVSEVFRANSDSSGILHGLAKSEHQKLSAILSNARRILRLSEIGPNEECATLGIDSLPEHTLKSNESIRRADELAEQAEERKQKSFERLVFFVLTLPEDCEEDDCDGRRKLFDLVEDALETGDVSHIKLETLMSHWSDWSENWSHWPDVEDWKHRDWSTLLRDMNKVARAAEFHHHVGLVTTMKLQSLNTTIA